MSLSGMTGYKQKVTWFLPTRVPFEPPVALASPTLSNVPNSSYSFSSHSQIQLQARPVQSLTHIFIFYFSCVYLECLTFPSLGPDLGWEIYWDERGGGRALSILVRREEALSFFLTLLPTHCVRFKTLSLELRAGRISGKSLKDLRGCNRVLVLPVLPGIRLTAQWGNESTKMV